MYKEEREIFFEYSRSVYMGNNPFKSGIRFCDVQKACLDS